MGIHETNQNYFTNTKITSQNCTQYEGKSEGKAKKGMKMKQGNKETKKRNIVLNQREFNHVYMTLNFCRNRSETMEVNVILKTSN